jgi:hypothetical protein
VNAKGKSVNGHSLSANAFPSSLFSGKPQLIIVTPAVIKNAIPQKL